MAFKNHETRFSERAQKGRCGGDVGRARPVTFVWNWLVVSPDNEIPFTSEKIKARSSLEQKRCCT
jgi:hypothetical protein